MIQETVGSTQWVSLSSVGAGGQPLYSISEVVLQRGES